MIRLIKPYISYDDVEKEFIEIFDSGIFTRGKYSKMLPKTLCEYTGAKYAFNATSATTALAACLEVLNIGKGDEVIVSDFSFPASSNVIEACEATPIFADVDLETFNMLAKELERKITPKTKAVIFVCALGNPSGLDKIAEICKEKNIYLINDAACAIGSSINNIKVGAFADFECFSFHPRKLLTAGEGGAITTKHKKFADLLDIKLMHGAKIENGKMDFVTYGYNYRLPELQCIMLVKQIKKLDSIVSQRQIIKDKYEKALSKKGYIMQKVDNNVVNNFQSVVLKVPKDVKRDELIEFLKENDIESTIGTYCLSACTYNKNKYNNIQKNAFYLQENTITLPCYEGLDVEKVINTILKF